MDIVDAIILGIIQGLTEFLPVSSSGHLEIGREVLNADLLATENLLFTIILHFATAISTIIIFKDDIMNLIKGSIANSINGNHKYLFKIIISMIPAVFIGLFFEEEIETIGTITIPEVFKRYMTHRASTRAATKLTNNLNLIKALAQQELLARASCMEYECNQTDASFFGFDHNSHYKSYRPYQTMLRR